MAHYRYIRHGEKERDSDEFHRSDNGKWMTFRKFYGSWWEALGYDKCRRRGKGQVAVRRKIVEAKRAHRPTAATRRGRSGHITR
jgi:hypothetical protein